MKKTLISLATACTVAIAGISVAEAQTPDTALTATAATTDTTNTTDITDSTLADDETSSSDGEAKELNGDEIAAITIGSIAAVAAALAAGYWAIQQRLIPNPLPGIIPGPPAPAPKPAPAPAPEPAPAPAPAPKPAPAPPPAPAPKPAPHPAPAPAPSAPYYQNCKAVWNDLGRPIRSNDPGYRSGLDRDGDGIGCESRPKY
ncbi:excalibur calcium-binding domain-containing protein [Corynebacterium sp.]|uniref:excalibur calcium-binding domain-containing protein n=1 Tax=Corynebacterium sp. TaxID=1720 RepID=UPI0026DD32AB|nr:excalibur calcium-binding domain-containing protein [Corynebacterium sp.]MDO5031285.1 excalibur calcium-binding domain-containing protein [Corynebacterium sp.]